MSTTHGHQAETIGIQQIALAFGRTFPKFRLITNLVFPMPESSTVRSAEADAIVVCEAGVFIFEIKGYRDCFVGREALNEDGAKQWFLTSTLNGEKSMVKDPLRQTSPKAKYLRTLLPAEIKIQYYALLPLPGVVLEGDMSSGVLTCDDLAYVPRDLRTKSRGIKSWHVLDEEEIGLTTDLLLSLQGDLTHAQHIANCEEAFSTQAREARAAASSAPVADASSLAIGKATPADGVAATNAGTEIVDEDFTRQAVLVQTQNVFKKLLQGWTEPQQNRTQFQCVEA